MSRLRDGARRAEKSVGRPSKPAFRPSMGTPCPHAEPEAGVLMLNTRFFRTPCAAPPAVASLKHVSSQLIVRGLVSQSSGHHHRPNFFDVFRARPLYALHNNPLYLNFEKRSALSQLPIPRRPATYSFRIPYPEAMIGYGVRKIIVTVSRAISARTANRLLTPELLRAERAES